MIRLVLADDHELVRAGIRALLERLPEIDVVAEAGDGRTAMSLIERHRPDLAILDITMPALNGLEIAARLPEVSPSTRVIVLSVHRNEPIVAKALRHGVSGYLLKESAATELAVAVRAVHRGSTYLSPVISMPVVHGYLRDLEAGGDADPLAELTTRQREVLQLVAEGRANRDIASLLGISVKTVEAHRSHIMERLDVHDLPTLVRLAARAGLIPSDD